MKYLKKKIIIIYLDNNISEDFIINSLINIDFQNSILIVINTKNHHFNFLNYFAFLTLDEIYENISKKTNINYLDLELIIGLFSDYYIGPNNYISYIWNYLSNNITFYINNYNDKYDNLENLIINNNILKSENFNNKIISYNFNLFKIFEHKFIKLDNKYTFYIDYYFNDFIFKSFFNKDVFTLNKDNSIIYNKNINIFKYNNDFYLKYFNQYQKIYNDFFIDNYKNDILSSNAFNINRINIIDKIVFIIQIFNIEYIKYYEELFNKYYYDKNYIIEFYLKKNNNKIYLKNEKNKINYLSNNNFIVILEDIYSKYSYNDLIFIIKSNNFNVININKEIYNFIYSNSLYIDYIDYLVFNIKVLESNETNKNIMDILKLNRLINKPNDIDQNIIYYLNKNYLNDFDFNTLIYNKLVLTKFLVFTEENDNIFYNFNKINNYIQENKKKIKYISYNISNEFLKFILVDDDLNDDDISDIDDEYSIDEKEKDNMFKIDIQNLNLFIYRLQENYIFIFDIFNHDIDNNKIFDKNNIENTVILNDFNELSILILNTFNLKKIGYLNNYYFKNNSLLNLNLFIFSKIIELKYYKFLNDDITNIDFNINTKIFNYFNKINLDTIISLRNMNNLNNIFNYDSIIDIYIINLNERYDKNIYD